MDGPEDAQEDFLREVERFVAVAQQMQGQLIDHPLVLFDQLRAGELVASRAALDERRFLARNIRPADNSGLFHEEVPGYVQGFTSYYIRSAVRPAKTSAASANGPSCTARFRPSDPPS
jgi:hypothetical protein